MGSQCVGELTPRRRFGAAVVQELIGRSENDQVGSVETGIAGCQLLDVTGRHATVAGHLDVLTPEERRAAAVRDTQDRQLAKSQGKFAPLE